MLTADCSFVFLPLIFDHQCRNQNYAHTMRSPKDASKSFLPVPPVVTAGFGSLGAAGGGAAGVVTGRC